MEKPKNITLQDLETTHTLQNLETAIALRPADWLVLRDAAGHLREAVHLNSGRLFVVVSHEGVRGIVWFD